MLTDLSKPHLKPLHHAHISIVCSTCGDDVDITIIDRRIFLLNKQMKSVDELAKVDRPETTASDLLS